jgi:hypothetical protein
MLKNIRLNFIFYIEYFSDIFFYLYVNRKGYEKIN